MSPAEMEARILKAIYAALTTINELRPKTERLRLSKDVILVGQAGALDSLQFVNFVVAAEQELSAALGSNIVLTDPDLLANPESVFATPASLAAFVEARLSEGHHE